MNPIDLAIKTLILSLLGLVAVAAMKRNSAATRHRFLVITLLGICLLPVVSSLAPAWQVPFLKVHVAATKSADTQTSVTKEVGSSDWTIHQGGFAASGTVSPATVASESFNWRLALTILWGLGAAVLFVRIGLRLLMLRRMENNLEMSDNSELQRLVTAICRQAGRRVLLLEGGVNEPPMTWGFSRPVLLLPEDAANWPAERLQSVVLHELAHIERNDWLTSMFGQVMCALFWFNPCAWFIAGKLRWESEAAADDRVLSLGVSGTTYATHLLEVLRDLSGSPQSADIALAMARPGSIDSRLRAILEVRSRHSARGSITLGLALAVLGIVAIVGSAGPTIVRAIEPNPASVQASTGSSEVTNPAVPSAMAPEPQAPAVPSNSVSSEEAEAKAQEAKQRDEHRTMKQEKTGKSRPSGKTTVVGASGASVTTNHRTGAQTFVSPGGAIVVTNPKTGDLALKAPGGAILNAPSKGADADEVADAAADAAETQKDFNESMEEAAKSLRNASAQTKKEVAEALKQAHVADKDVERLKKSGVLDKTTLAALDGVSKMTQEAIQNGLAEANKALRAGSKDYLKGVTKGMQEMEKGLKNVPVQIPVPVPVVKNHPLVVKHVVKPGTTAHQPTSKRNSIPPNEPHH